MYACGLLGSKFTNCFVIPQRYMLAIMVSLSIFNAYQMRICLSITITQMVPKKNHTEISNTSEVCPSGEKYTSFELPRDTIYDWDENTQGLILGSFYYGYIITHLPGGLLAEKLGGKHVIGIGLLVNAIATLFFPLVITSSGGSWVLVVIFRIIMGMGQGVLYPAVSALLAQWIPESERGGISGICYAGQVVGTIISTAISGVLITHFRNWKVVFYFFGGCGLIWNIFWQLTCFSYPRTNPCLKPKEKEFLDRELTNLNEEKLPTPWKHILTSVPVWALIAGQFGHDWAWFTLVTDLPKYMDAVLKFQVQDNGVVSSIPYLLMWLSIVGSGYLADTLLNKKIFSLTTVRRIWGTIGTIGPAIFMVLAGYIGCDKIAAVVMFTLSLFAMGFWFPGMKINGLDLSPNFAATIMAVQNGLGVFAGMAAPAVVGVLAPNQTLEEWKLVFWVTFIVSAVANVIYFVFMSAKIQKWNDLNASES